MVVIAIIGVLSAVVVSSVDIARSKARDSRRMSDLHEIESALSLYYSDNGSFPSGALWSSWAGWSSFIPSQYISTVPIDPINYDNGGCNIYPNCHLYHYCPYNNNQNFVLAVNLENSTFATTSANANCGEAGPNHFFVSQ